MINSCLTAEHRILDSQEERAQGRALPAPGRVSNDLSPALPLSLKASPLAICMPHSLLTLLSLASHSLRSGKLHEAR